MSVEAMARALGPRPGLTPTQKLVLIGIANHDGDGGSWPSVDTLAGYAEVSRRQVQKVIAQLVELGLVTVHLNAGGSKDTPADRRPNRYELHLDGVSPVTPRVGNGVSPSAPRGVAQRGDGVSPGTPEPSIEPSIEPSNTPPPADDDSSPSSEVPKPEQPQVATPDLVARGVIDDYWLWVKAQTGHPPAGLGYIALVNIVRPFVEAGWTVASVKHALADMFGAGRSLSRQSLEAQLRRLGPAPARRVDSDRGGESGPVAV